MSVLRSLRLRLALWYVLVLAIVLAAFSAGIYLTLRHNLSSSLDDQLVTRTEVLLGAVEIDAGSPTLAGIVSDFGGEIDDQVVRTYDAQGAMTFDSSAGSGERLEAADLERALGGDDVSGTVRVDDDTMRIRVVPIQRDGDIVGVLEVGLPQDEVTDPLRTLLLILSIAYPATLLLASAGGVFLAGRALSPIDGITRLARRISGDDLSQRLDLDLPNDEVGRLARTFDEMIERLDVAFQRQRQFTADASHELRTPLTAIRGQIEVALAQDRDAADFRAVLRSVNEEIDRLISLVGSLLMLARADAGEIPIANEVIEIGELVDGAVEQLRPLAGEKELTVAVEPGPPTTVRVDQDLLLQLLLNLLDNAIKYSDRGDRVTVSWAVDGSGARIRVSDTGAGIPADHVDRVFDRFYRVDKARSRSEGGAGLGLSISRWIARTHGGDLTVQSQPGEGTTVELLLPLDRVQTP